MIEDPRPSFVSRAAAPPYARCRRPASARFLHRPRWLAICFSLYSQTAMIENGFVYLPEAAPWIAEYLHELTDFPNGKHDDQVDSTAQFLDWFKRPFPGQGIYEFTRMRAQALEQARNPQTAQPNWAIGCLEWQAEQEKARLSGRT